LIGLADADAVVGIGVLTVSLIVSAILGPMLAGLLAPTVSHGSSWSLLGRFSLVVLAPLAIGLAARALAPGLRRAGGCFNGLAALTVCVLLYAAISGVHGGSQLASDLVASTAFIIVSLAFAGALVGLASARGLDPTAVLLTSWLRDFAVAAALATQAFGPSAASVAGVYGALMLLAGALSATLLRRRRAQMSAGPCSRASR
jgi:hypothetical protein